MTCSYRYHTPDGFDDMLMESDGEFLTGLLFIGQDVCENGDKHGPCPHSLDGRNEAHEETARPVFQETARWLDVYFSGRQPDFTPAYRIQKLTPFRKEVCDIMRSIPFGGTRTYGEIAAEIARRHGSAKMSAQAVGGAVGWNPLCILVPCHRVIGAHNKLTGYGGGIQNKIALLKLEGHDINGFAMPDGRNI